MTCVFLTALFLFTFLPSGHLYEYRMANVSGCPKNQSEVIIATAKLGCGQDKYGNNQYMCLPNKNKSVLVEFCYDGVMGIQESGICLQIFEGKLIRHSCKYFSCGCPEKDFYDYELYKYPACQDINTEFRCYVSDPGCPPRQHTGKPSNQYTIVYVIIIPGFLLAIFGLIMIFLWRRRKRIAKSTRRNSTDEIEIKQPLSEEKEIRIVLLGGEGGAYSATANSILGTNSFKSDVSNCSGQSFYRFGYNLIVDTPGIFDQKPKKELRNDIILTPPGPHVFIVVLNKDRFPTSFQQTLEHFVEFFGEDWYKYVILLFTNEDCKSEEPIKDLVITFPPELKTKIEKCGGRVREFNSQRDERDAQAEELIRYIREVIKTNDGGCYRFHL